MAGGEEAKLAHRFRHLTGSSQESNKIRNIIFCAAWVYKTENAFSSLITSISKGHI